MLALRFGGWAQVRLATDPDPFDDAAGTSGPSAAMSWEPPLDRVIRFQDPVAARSHAPAVGVRVLEALDDKRTLAGHPLLGARLDLLRDPVFEGRNGLVADDGAEPIVPFVLRVEGEEGIVLEREDPPAGPWNPDRPDLRVVAHRSGRGAEADAKARREVGEAVGVRDAKAWREEREARLLEELAGEDDPARCLGLELRIEMLEPIALVRVPYRFAIGAHGGVGRVEDPHDRLGVAVDVRQAWPIDVWFGAWDNDGLLAWVAGELRLPTTPATAAHGA